MKLKMPFFSHFWILGALCALSLAVAIGYVMLFGQWTNRVQQGLPKADSAQQPSGSAIGLSGRDGTDYPYHDTIATKFWVGEAADESNAYIPNHESAWVGDWVGEFGGIDDPAKRCGYSPCGFVPQQNVFYVALPFNDIDANGMPKDEVTLRRIPWYEGHVSEGVSLIKNRWVEVWCGAKIAYGQVEDVGPMYEDDIDYVFGESQSKYKAGIDLSPALNDYLGVNGQAAVRWRFVEETLVPDGPWKRLVTTSQINY